MNIKDITIGVVFTKHDFSLDAFFGSCLQNDKLSKDLNFVIIDNSCNFDLQSRVDAWLKNYKYKIVKNDKIESLAHNHNLILYNSDTDYIIHNNDEVYFREQWLTNTIVWILKNGFNKVAHLCRCSKGYHKSAILKMGYFNELIQGKDGSDADIEYRETKYLDKSSITIEQWRQIESREFENKIIGQKWHKEWFEPCKSDSWIGQVAVQPDNIQNNKQGDSNLWLKEEKNLSNSNKQVVIDWWSVIGKQGLDDINPEFTKKLKEKYAT
jgi:hypothetical protein